MSQQNARKQAVKRLALDIDQRSIRIESEALKMKALVRQKAAQPSTLVAAALLGAVLGRMVHTPSGSTAAGSHTTGVSRTATLGAGLFAALRIATMVPSGLAMFEAVRKNLRDSARASKGPVVIKNGFDSSDLAIDHPTAT